MLCLLTNFQPLVFGTHQEIGGTELHTHTTTTICLRQFAHRGIIKNNYDTLEGGRHVILPTMLVDWNVGMTRI